MHLKYAAKIVIFPQEVTYPLTECLLTLRLEDFILLAVDYKDIRLHKPIVVLEVIMRNTVKCFDKAKVSKIILTHGTESENVITRPWPNEILI